ncbi:MAG: hypothetical protein ABH854_04625, partial [Candidatus Diapherotrites archaeon]
EVFNFIGAVMGCIYIFQRAYTSMLNLQEFLKKNKFLIAVVFVVWLVFLLQFVFLSLNIEQAGTCHFNDFTGECCDCVPELDQQIIPLLPSVLVWVFVLVAAVFILRYLRK